MAARNVPNSPSIRTGREVHRHLLNKEERYRFTSVRKLRQDFEADVRRHGGNDDEKERVEVGVGGLADALDGFEKAWRDAEKGGTRVPMVRLTFESLPLLLKNLTPARWALLEYLKRNGPLSINGLATRLERHYKNVHTDVTRLIEMGLVERGVDQRVAVPWDVVAAEIQLAA